MDIVPIQLEDKHYRAVKAIFRDTFDPKEFQICDLNYSWHGRSVDESYGFFLGSNLIGFVITSYHVQNKSNLYLNYIAFEESYRGKGIGTAVLMDMLKSFKELGRSVHLYPEHPGLNAWYERLGFKKTHRGFYNFHSYNTRQNAS